MTGTFTQDTYSHSSDIRQISWASCTALNEEATGQVDSDSKEVGKENHWMFLASVDTWYTHTHTHTMLSLPVHPSVDT